MNATREYPLCVLLEYPLEKEEKRREEGWVVQGWRVKRSSTLRAYVLPVLCNQAKEIAFNKE